MTYNYNDDSDMAEILTVTHCSFTKLGGTLGAAIHIQKISIGTTPLLIRIEYCNFTENEANSGSAVYAVDRRFDPTLSNGLIIKLLNVNAKDNTLSPGITTDYVSSVFITGIFHSETCHFKFDCNKQCIFSSNQPSVFYGHFGFITISGNATFFNNTSLYGGALDLYNTVAFIHQDSNLYFANNHATMHGGAIYIDSSSTNVQSQDICPIQFIGNHAPIFLLENINQISSTVNVTFKNNTVGPISNSHLQSLYANVYYACSWYPNTLTQIYLGKRYRPINGTRQSVYNQMFSFVLNECTGNDTSIRNEHLSIAAYLPCPCDKNKKFNAGQCINADINDSLQLGINVTVGISFNISLITLDVIGSIGHSSYLYSEVSSSESANILTLPREQRSRSFSINEGNCTPIHFTIYSLNLTIPKFGILHLSLSRNNDHRLHFTLIDKCLIGFSLQRNADGLYGCTCGEFFSKLPMKNDVKCNSVSGKVERIDIRSWLSVLNDRVEYTQLCLPAYCTSIHSEFNIAQPDVLCNPHHTGRACGACDNGFGKKFGSKYCRKCCNVWLVTILLFGVLGIILVLIIHLLKLTITIGTINGLIFFCNVVSINENVFFNSSKFSYIRLLVSLINLDLGFEMCFYKEMTEIAKTGLQFVFPLYLWLLMFIIIMVERHYFRSRKSTHSAVPVLGTLIFLSYSKLLRTTISVFSFVTVRYSEEDSDFSRSKYFIAWQPDPNITYLEWPHIVLFLVALVFTVFFILPLAFAFTFPKFVLRSKKMSYFFPLLDSVYAPYKNHYRFWFGVRIIVLMYYSGMESILLSYQDSLLLSGVVVILLFTLIQAYIHPFKSTLNNTLDLMFMGIFIALSIVVLYLYPNTPGHGEYITVNILGGIAFLLFCFIILFHLHDALMHFTKYSIFIEALQIKFNMKTLKGNWKVLNLVNRRNLNHESNQDLNQNINKGSNNYAYLQESLLEEQFN